MQTANGEAEASGAGGVVTAAGQWEKAGWCNSYRSMVGGEARRGERFELLRRLMQQDIRGKKLLQQSIITIITKAQILHLKTDQDVGCLMPRKKKLSQSKKPALLFLESPLKKEKYKEVSSLPSAVNPRQVSCIPVDQRSAFTWVLPEFDTTTPRCKQKSNRVKHHKVYSKQSVSSKPGSGRRSFVPLTFLGNGGIPVQKENHKVEFSTCQNVKTSGKVAFRTNKTSFLGSKSQWRKVNTFGKAQNLDALDKQKYSLRSAAKRSLVGKSTAGNIPVKRSSFCHPLNSINKQMGVDSDETEISLSEHSSQSSDEFTLPHVSTPTADGMPSPAAFQKNICSVLRNNELNKRNITPLPCGLLDCIDKCSGLNDFSDKATSADVFVQDTPEHEYGLKATWRRRPHIMQYLKDHGKLTSTNVLVGS